MKSRLKQLIAILLGVVGLMSVAQAHETDQFTLPAGRDFADLGGYVNGWAFSAIERGVAKVNDRNRQQQPTIDSGEVSLQLKEEIVRAVNSEFGSAYDVIEDYEKLVHSAQLQLQHPGKITGYKQQIENIYQHVHFALDPRQFFRLWHASTFMAFGTYLGADKMGHFTDMGMHYYRAYLNTKKSGGTDAAALAAAVKIGVEGPIFSEKGMVGYLSAGDYSNADLVANYLGLLFYLNLTDPVMIKGRMQPPMLLRNGNQWRIAPHVRLKSGFFSVFISDHLDEALNPGLFESGMRNAIRDAVAVRATDILNRRVDKHGNRRTRAYFDALLKELKTYYGQDYGHDGNDDELIWIGNTCFESNAPEASPTTRSAIGLTTLHEAVIAENVSAVRQLLLQGAEVNAGVRSNETFSPEWGSTALHYAACTGNVEIAQLLISAGAKVNVANDRGITPLHRGLASADMTALLLNNGAQANVVDARGNTPLHWAAEDGQPHAAELLLQHGSDVRAPNNFGFTALLSAALSGNDEVAAKLVAHGSDVAAQTHLGTSALQLAVGPGREALIDLLLSHGADVKTADQIGWTALHDAADQDLPEIANLLLSAGAPVDAANKHGRCPLELAARRGGEVLVSMLLDHHASINAQDGLGRTALHEAAANDQEKVVALLLDRGANSSLQDDSGMTPIRLASQRGHKTVARLLHDFDRSRVPDHQAEGKISGAKQR